MIQGMADGVDSNDPTGPAVDMDVIKPERPHDDLAFEELARRYNFRLTSNPKHLFTRLVVKECRARPSPVRVLDIGCGRGVGRIRELPWVIRRFADELWGIDPDESVGPMANLFDHHEHAFMETAKLPEEYFDVAFSYMVMEHVSDPDAFMAAVMRCLKPGGAYLFATPNERHYFTRIASTLHKVHLDEFVLRLIKGHKKDEYHYPVEYRFNGERRIDACAQRQGFQSPEYAYVESEGPIGYQPGPLRPLFHVFTIKRQLFKSPKALITLLCRMTKPADRPTP